MSGSGEDIKTGGVAQEQPSGFEQFMTNPAFQKYITNMGIGMQGGKNLSESLSGGFARAGQGYLQDLEEQKRKKIVRDILGDGDLSKLSGADAYKKGLELIASGDPSLQTIGQHMVTSAMSKADANEWVTTSKNINGQDIPVQINTKTGEVKPYSPEIAYGQEYVYNSDTMTYNPKYGPQGKNINRPEGQLQVPIASLTDTSINKTAASRLPTDITGPVDYTQELANMGGTVSPTAPTGTVDYNKSLADMGIKVPPGLSNRQQAEFIKSQAETLQKEQMKQAEEQRGVTLGQQKIEAEDVAKKQIEAKNYFTPTAVEERKMASETAKQRVSDLTDSINKFHDKWGKVGDIPVARTVLGAIGDPAYASLKANAADALESAIQNLKSTGSMSASMINSNAELTTFKNSLLNEDLPYSAMLEQVKRIKTAVENANTLVKAQEKTMSGYLGNASPGGSDQPEIIKGNDGNNYIKLPNGNYKKVP